MTDPADLQSRPKLRNHILRLLVSALVVGVVGLFLWVNWPGIIALLNLRHETYGRIIVDSPEVYTRERLVNDRFQQVAWLRKQLDITVDKSTRPQQFRSTDATVVSSTTHGTEIRGSVEVLAGQQSPPSKQSPPPAPAPNVDSLVEIQPTTIDRFRAMNSFRDEVRTEMMEAQLDDRHDIDGNTIYRLTFDTTILAGERTNALAVIRVRMAHHDREKLPDDALYNEEYKSLYEDWRRHLNRLISDSISNLTTAVSNDIPGYDISINLLTYFRKQVCLKLADLALLKNDDCNEANTVNQSKTGLKIARDLITIYTDQYRSFLDDYSQERYESMQKGRSEPSSTPLPSYYVAKIKCLSQANQNKPSKPMMWSEGPCPPSISGSPGLMGVIYLYLHLKAANPEDIRTKTKVNTPLNELSDKDRRDNLFKIADYFVTQVKDRVDQHCPTGQMGSHDCPFAQPSLDDIRCAISQYRKDDLETRNYPLPNTMLSESVQQSGSLSISKYFTLEVEGEEIKICNLLVKPKPNVSEVLKLLRKELEGYTEVYVYGVAPKNLAQRVSTSLGLQDTLQLFLKPEVKQGLVDLSGVIDHLRGQMRTVRMIENQPVVIGFGLGEAADSDAEPVQRVTADDEAAFGWIIAPQFKADLPGGSDAMLHKHQQYSLSAIISVPSWWRSAKFTVERCWLSFSRLGYAATRAEDICAEEKEGAAVDGDRGGTRSYYIRLPGVPTELSRKLRFDVIQEPYLKWSAEQNSQQLEIGRPGELLIEGGRLWRSTTVTLGAQSADEIIVLPNMAGIIAKFYCVRRPAGMSPAPSVPGGPSPGPRDLPSGAGESSLIPGSPPTTAAADPQPDPQPAPSGPLPSPDEPSDQPPMGGPGETSGPLSATVRVWTSEGVTDVLPVRLLHWEEETKNDHPCYIKLPATDSLSD